MNGNFEVLSSVKSQISRGVGFGYNALKSAYINPQDLQVRYPILNLDESMVQTLPQRTDEFIGNIGSTLSEISHNMSVALSVSGKYNAFSGAISSEFRHDDSVSVERVYYKHMAMHIRKRQYIADRDKYRDYLMPEFVKDLEGPAALAPDKLFDRYGTHLILEVFFGGRVEANFATIRKKTMEMNSIKESIEAAYSDISGKVSGEYAKTTKAVVEDSQIRIKAVGGAGFAATSEKNFHEAYVAWINALNNEDNQEICHLPGKNSFIPLWELCKDPVRSQEIEKVFAVAAQDIENALVALNTYVKAIKFVSDENQEKAKQKCSSDWILVDKDLNAGAQGNYIYLCYQLGAKAEAYSNFCMEISSDKLSSGTYTVKQKAKDAQGKDKDINVIYDRVMQDLNQGAGGNYIHLGTTKDSHFPPVRRMDVVFSDDAEQPCREWKSVCWKDKDEQADCNQSVHGKYIYIKYKRE